MLKKSELSSGKKGDVQMDCDLRAFSEQFKPIACIVSVEKFPDGTYGNIRLVTANSAFISSFEDPFKKNDSESAYRNEFVPDQPYERYIPKDLNFEDMCYRSAILGETLHTYTRPEKMPSWMYLTVIPLKSDRENVGYCAYLRSFTESPNYSLMSTISPDAAAKVLQICMKLRGSSSFMSAVNDVIGDIRDLCDAGHCCILLSDFGQRKCSVLCEALSKTTDLLSMKKYVNDDFFDVVETWHGTIGGNTCVIIKDQHDWEYLEKTNPVWYNSMKPAGAKSIVLFPLRYRDETLGYIWAINFDVSQTVKIKEMLELTTYFLASEIANYQLFNRLEVLSSKDLLTGVLNRNALNNRVDSFVSGENRRYRDRSVGIVFADLNGLKQVNDSQGHFAGDLLLKNAAISMQKHFPDDEIYRAGGDEFTVFVMGAEREAFEKKVNDFRAAVSEPDGVCFAVGMAFGTVGSIREAMHSADEDMYAQKELFYKTHPGKKHGSR